MSENKEKLKEQFNDSFEKEIEEQAEYSRILDENKKKAAKIQHHRLTIQEEEMEKNAALQDSLKQEDITKRSFDRSKLLKDIEDRKNAVIFLDKDTSKHIVAAPGSLIVIPSMTNNGKSTLTAHIAKALVNEGKKTLILSNEEKEGDVQARISCLRKEISFGTYKQSLCTPEQIETVMLDAEYLSNNGLLTVISPITDIDAFKVTTIKGVMTTLEKAKDHFDAVIIDYYQNINKSDMGATDPWHVNNKLAGELNIFKDSAPFPLIVFAQCKGIENSKKVDDKSQLDFENNHPMYRWKGGAEIITFATDIVELTKDYNNSCSILFSHKVRFAHGDLARLHVLPFDKKMQRFVKWTPEWDAQATASKVKQDTQSKTKETGLGNIFDGRDD